VSSVPAAQLGELIEGSLRPPAEGERHIRQVASDLLLSCLQGGSYGRGTFLKGDTRGTLVLFLNHLEQFQDQKKNQQQVLNIIEQRLTITKLQGYLMVHVSTRWQSVHLQVLPAFNPLGVGEPSRWVYRALKRTIDQTGASPGEFSVCFTGLQEKFFSKYPRKLKDLILLIKYWYQQCQKKWESSSYLDPYALELVTVYAWEQGCQAEDFGLAEGVRTVLRLITQQEQLCVYWTVNYNFEDEMVRNILLHQLRSQRPVILDPTDPTHNVVQNHHVWKKLKEEAQLWLASPSLNNVSPAPHWNVLPAPLFITPGHLLDKFIKDFLQPTKVFREQICRAVDMICTFLKENCFRGSTIKVQNIVKGGSTAKGTALKHGSDADIVVFLSSLKSYTSQKAERSDIIREIRQQLETCQQTQNFEVTFEVSKWKAPRVLRFTLKSKSFNESVDFDVLPAFNALGQEQSKPSPRVYAELIELYKSPDVLGGEFSTCFTKLQSNFIESRPIKLKDLIRLVKHWFKQCERKMKPKGSLPPKYALELLTVYAWEQGSGLDDFDTAEGFRTVLELVTQYQQLCIFWTINYSFEDEGMRKFLLNQIQRTRPVILDPAEPTGDVGGGDRWCWHLLAKEAKEWLASPCFTNGAGYPVMPWKVPTVQTAGSCGAQLHLTVSKMFS
uniref:2'-5' oligoadenylate synthase n=1 Tax=Jaculus jaculus TaxID=51337 RepID=A0A8C5K002_JACJA